MQALQPVTLAGTLQTPGDALIPGFLFVKPSTIDRRLKE